EVAAKVARTRQPFHLTVTRTESGLDIAANDSGPLTAPDRSMFTDFIVRSGIARLTVDGEIIVEPRKPLVDFGGTFVTPPPGGFLQAVASAENAMAELVTGHVGKAKKVLDLF